MRITTLALPVLLATSLAAGCSRSPRVTFYVLQPEQQPASQLKHEPSVSVGPVTLPEVVDRQQLVVHLEGPRVDILELHRWGAPLKGQIASVMADNLSRLLASDRVFSYAQTGRGDTRYRVQVDVRRIEAVPGEGVSLEALWTVRGASGEVAAGRFAGREKAEGTGYDPLVAALNRAVAALSAEVAAAIPGK